MQSLIEGLREFGLNPNNWKILLFLRQNNTWLVVHKKHPSFCLKGKSSKGKWKDMECLIV